MLWLTGYYDACGHPKGKHMLAVGGYVSSAPMWHEFERRWQRELHSHGIDVPFHMTDFMACKGAFVDWHARGDETANHKRQLAYSIPKDWGVIDEEALLRFCADFGVPRRDERRIWDGPFGRS